MTCKSRFYHFKLTVKSSYLALLHTLVLADMIRRVGDREGSIVPFPFYHFCLLLNFCARICFPTKKLEIVEHLKKNDCHL